MTTKQNETSLNNTLGIYLREKREEQELNLRQFAAKIDTDQATWSKIENGHRLPPKEQLPQIARALKITFEELKTQYYAGIVTKTLYDSGLKDKVLKVAEEQIKYVKNKQSKSIHFDKIF